MGFSPNPLPQNLSYPTTPQPLSGWGQTLPSAETQTRQTLALQTAMLNQFSPHNQPLQGTQKTAKRIHYERLFNMNMWFCSVGWALLLPFCKLESGQIKTFGKALWFVTRGAAEGMTLGSLFSWTQRWFLERQPETILTDKPQRYPNWLPDWFKKQPKMFNP